MAVGVTGEEQEDKEVVGCFVVDVVVCLKDATDPKSKKRGGRTDDRHGH